MADMVVASWLKAASVTAAGTGKDNLLTADPKEVWAGGPAAVNIDLDFGAVVEIDTFALLYTTIPAAATWTISGGAASYTGTTIKPTGAVRAPGSRGPRHHGLFVADAPVSLRYLRLAIGAASGAWTAGQAFTGLNIKTSWPREHGAGRQLIDTGSTTALRSGGFAVVPGARKAGYSWTFGDLPDSEVDAFWALAQAVGETAPVLVVEDKAATAGLNDRIHYGKFGRFEPYGRQDPDRTRWAFTMEEWR